MHKSDIYHYNSINNISELIISEKIIKL